VASGASESEIFIWDLNNPDKPMTPGAKAQVSVTCSSSCYMERTFQAVCCNYHCHFVPVVDLINENANPVD